MFLLRPVPAFYCCYLLRSSVRHGAVYVGSTPNPGRRLRQHNGVARGGAARTNRENLRPWEMTCIVSGFPSQVAALQFEWAWQNPHITLHIPPSSRIQHATQTKRSGQPRRPRHSLSSLLSSLHLLLRVPSFSRWPLELRFLSRDVYISWLKISDSAKEPIRETLKICKDFPDEEDKSTPCSQNTGSVAPEAIAGSGIDNLDVTYASQAEYLKKSRSLIDFERKGQCAICDEQLCHETEIHTLCPTPECDAFTHIRCLSAHFTRLEDGPLVPVVGTCPSCKTELRWVDLMKELSLRMRGRNEIDNLLKLKLRRAVDFSSSFEVQGAVKRDLEEIQSLQRTVGGHSLSLDDYTSHADDPWHVIEDSGGSETGSREGDTLK